MKTVIALKGRKKVGKTYSIRELYERLKTIYILENDEEFFSDYITKHKDETCRQFRINGILCGFISVGDPSELAFTTGVLNLFLQNGCQLIICACRTKSTTRQNVQRLASDGYKIHFMTIREKSDNTIEVLLSEMVKFLNQK